MTSGMEGICRSCGSRYHGWALSTQRNQICLKCGSSLEIRKDGALVRSAFSPFQAGEYVIGAGQKEWEDLRDKNLLFYLTQN